MPQIPISSQIQIKVSGNSAVYAVAIIASLICAIYGSSVQDIVLKYLITGIGLFLFVSLIILSVIIILKKSGAFSLKEEKHVIVDHRYFKHLNGEIKEAISAPIPPPKLLNGEKKSQ